MNILKKLIVQSVDEAEQGKKEKKKEISPDKFFYVKDGPALKTIGELRDALSSMSDEQFTFHTIRDGNDFSNWLWFVWGEKKLADKVFKAKTKKDIIRLLSELK